MTQSKIVTISGVPGANKIPVAERNNIVTATDKSSALQVAVMPNPVKSGSAIINILNAKGAEIQLNIFSSLGSKVLSQKEYKPSGKIHRKTINVNTLLPGTYIVQVIDGNNMAMCRMIRE